MARMVKAVLNGQYEIILPEHRAARPEWYTENGWEKKRLYSMYGNIGGPKTSEGVHPFETQDIVFYVGAEEGEMAALCQMWGAKVVLFEPNDRVWPNIKAIWDANNLEYPLASFSGFASNKDTDREGYIPGGFPNSAHGEVIGDHGFKELSDPSDIPQIKIDTLVKRSGIIPTVITLDVEGSEWEVLRGAEQTLREYHPKIWLSLHPEFLYHHFKEHSGDLRRWLRDIGYKEELLDYQHEVHLYYHYE